MCAHARLCVLVCLPTQGHVFYRPKRRDALLFYDKEPDYKMEDRYSQHTGCPVVKGVKWNAVKWVHGDPFRPETYKEEVAKQGEYKEAFDPGKCLDLNAGCEEWAKSGECDKNPGYMKVGGQAMGLGVQGRCCRACWGLDERMRGRRVARGAAVITKHARTLLLLRLRLRLCRAPAGR